VGAGYDIAVVILNSAVSVTPKAISRGGAQTPASGGAVRIVGFGQNTSTSGFGTKRTANTTVTSALARFLNVGRTGTQKCFGDSGGPTFYTGSDGVERVVGVTSYGNSNCTSGGTDTRVDAYLPFLDQYLGGTTPPPGDTTPPVASLFSPANGSTVATGTTTIDFNVTDNVGVAEATLTWNYNSKVSTCSSPASGWTCARSGTHFRFTANVGTGARTFKLQATDTSGNSTTTPTYSLTFQ
jgi:secreted trypsin-like serine protease